MLSTPWECRFIIYLIMSVSKIRFPNSVYQADLHINNSKSFSRRGCCSSQPQNSKPELLITLLRVKFLATLISLDFRSLSLSPISAMVTPCARRAIPCAGCTAGSVPVLQHFLPNLKDSTSCTDCCLAWGGPLRSLVAVDPQIQAMASGRSCGL